MGSFLSSTLQSLNSSLAYTKYKLFQRCYITLNIIDCPHSRARFVGLKRKYMQRRSYPQLGMGNLQLLQMWMKDHYGRKGIVTAFQFYNHFFQIFCWNNKENTKVEQSQNKTVKPFPHKYT